MTLVPMSVEANSDQGIAAALETLTETSLDVRQGAIARAADVPKSFGPAFFATIYDQFDDPLCKWYAIRSLGDLAAEDYLDVLIDALKHPDQEVGKSSLHLIAARSIGQIGPSAVDRLLRLLDESSGSTTVAVIDALGEVGATKAIPALQHCLESEDRALRLWSALSLAKIGTASIPALRESLSRADAALALLIVDAFAIINETEIIPALADAATSFRSSVSNYLLRGRRDRVMNLISLVRVTGKQQGTLGAKARAFLNSFSDEIKAIEAFQDETPKS